MNKGKIVWSSSGKEVTFSHWRYESEGEMDNEEYCGALTVDKTWLARECSTIQYNFICEKNSGKSFLSLSLPLNKQGIFAPIEPPFFTKGNIDFVYTVSYPFIDI